MWAAPGPGPAVVGCGSGHRFDVARQGHVMLLPGAGSRLRSDTPEMVRARVRVLDAGLLAAVTTALVDTAPVDTALVDGPLSDATRTDAVRDGRPPGRRLLVDVGAGTGHHAAAVLHAAPDLLGCALELSPAALRVAARAHPRLAAVGVDATGRLPLQDGSVDVVTAVFAPLPSPAELERVAAADALLVVVTPTTDHLRELRSRLQLLDIPAGKPARVQERLGDGWTDSQHVEVRTEVSLDRSLAADVVAMGPNAWHPDERRTAALAALPDRLVETIAVTVSSWRRAAGGR